MTHWFISDTHFGHRYVIKAAKRPFDSVEKMNNVLIDNINNKVKTYDTLWHLGDFAYKISNKKLITLRNKIKCKNINLIIGNHDKRICKRKNLRSLFSSISEFFIGYIQGQPFILSHYRNRNINIINNFIKNNPTYIHLYGHTHIITPKNYNSTLFHSYNITVENTYYKPFNLSHILTISGIKNDY